MKSSIVIVGGVAAGPKMAAKARRENPDVPITLVTDEAVISYAACGTPYYLGHTFQDRQKLLVREAEDFGRKNAVTMLTGHRATKLDPAAHTLEVRNLADDTTQTLSYSKLGLATGASPVVPPLPGLPADGVFTLRSVTDAFAIEDYTNLYNPRRVVVIGAGFIGLEVAEQWAERGFEVTLIELLPQVLGPVDPPVAAAVHKELERLGIEVLVGTKVEGFTTDHRNRVTRVETSRGPVPAELVLLGVGVRPNTQLAVEAGLRIGETRAIWVDETMRTSDPDVYAAGDCAEQTHLITGQPAWVPLGSTANKQGRVAAINMTGGRARFPGILGTAMVRVGRLNVGRTGLGERELDRMGVEYESVMVPQADRPSYMPGSAEVVLILHAERATGRVLGGQVFGPGAMDKRIDILATALTAGMIVETLQNLDLGYAPPFAPAMDVIITAANVMEGKLQEKTAGVMPHRLAESLSAQGAGPACILLDCRERDEWQEGRLPGAQLVPLGELSDRCRTGRWGGDGESNGGPVVVYCKGGLRSADAYRRLRQAGVEDVRYLDGGVTGWTADLER